MKPNFSLDLSHEGIVLSHRSPKGTWTVVGDVKLEDPALGENLSFLRSTAVGLEGKGFGTKLILPNSQVLYLDLHAPGPDDDSREAQIAAGLAGKTPYEVSDLVFDWTGSGDIVQVAVVAKETLDEAEEFAVEHRFNPISFVGRASAEPDAWQPFFGRKDYSFAILNEDADVRDVPRAVPAEAPEKDSIFAAAAEAGPDADVEESHTRETNFFQDQPIAETGNNIFEDSSETDPQITPTAAPVADQPEPESGPIPSFASRRATVGPADPAGFVRRIEAVSPRFDIAQNTASADTSNQVPPAENDPSFTQTAEDTEAEAGDDGYRDEAPSHTPLIAEDQLRAAFAAEPSDSNEGGSKFSGISGTFLANLKALRDRIGPIFNAVVLKILDVLAIVVTALIKFTGRVFKRKKPETTPSDPVVADGNAATHPAIADKPGRRRAVLAGIAALLLLGLLGLGYAFFPGGSPERVEGGSADPSNAVFSATDPERGVRADNRPRTRPSDMAALIASSNGGTEPELDLSLPIRPVRPARRSVFEGQVDPDAELPDTATPVTNLSEQELADLRAAGVSVPTLEEMAEGRDGTASEDMSTAEIQAAYEQTGILQSLIPLPRPQSDDQREHIFVAATDTELKANDAIILPDFNNGTQDDPPARMLSPLAAGTVFELDENGLVIATAEGTLNPEGILVKLGKPSVTPPSKPRTEELVPPNPLLALKPKARPADLKTGEDAIFVQGRLTLAELRKKRATHRPESEQFATSDPNASPSQLAVLTSFQPARRPSDFEKTVEKTRVRIASTRPATGTLTDSGVNNGPVLPTRANVAKTATIKNAINLAKINLIGVYGTASKRKALLRLPSGRLVRVKIGDRVDGGRVAAIGVSSLSYVKSGRNRVLKVPE